MQRYILRRLLLAVFLLFGITVINFLIVNLAPGDPLSRMMNPEIGLSQDQLAGLREKFGLDKPLTVRYVYWLKEAVTGNFGYRMSVQDHRPVGALLKERIPRTIELMLAAIFIANATGIVLGVISAVKRYSVLDYFLTVTAFLGISTPGFFVALGMIYLLAVRLGWFPTSGIRSPLRDPSLTDQLHHLVLPAAALAIEYVAGMMRQARASMLEALGQDYIVTARAKGLREHAVVYRHALRNAALPLVTLFGLYLPGLIGGSIIIETIFGWPGMGSLAIDAVHGRDYNMLMAINLVGATMVLVTNLVIDIAYAYIDPRINYR
ncbi:MAG TPA: ABC transporter permease [Thermomicrobiales bacterium]